MRFRYSSTWLEAWEFGRSARKDQYTILVHNFKFQTSKPQRILCLVYWRTKTSRIRSRRSITSLVLTGLSTTAVICRTRRSPCFQIERNNFWILKVAVYVWESYLGLWTHVILLILIGYRRLYALFVSLFTDFAARRCLRAARSRELVLESSVVH